MTADIYIFDRKSVDLHRNRASGNLDNHDFLLQEVADRLGDRLLDITRTFPKALDLGSQHELLVRTLGSRGDIKDFSALEYSANKETAGETNLIHEELLPVEANSFDLVISNLCLHWVNDLPGTFVQINRCLKPDGLFLAAMIGGESLKELRSALMEAEMEVEGGVSPRVSPLIDVRDAGALLQRAGFALPVADFDRIEVSYASAFDLMKELRGMGETNAVHNRRKNFTRRETLLRAAEIYQDKFLDDEGRIMVTFDIIYLAGWAPHDSQQKPLRPGSATASLADFLTPGEKS
ncbi:methyltransferase domain-containing protein [Kiloniella laminariae]|uniref:Methyltransferase domain-containing protein n=1 Tax=Kiloniella laminariae TaxID=454162 RepID=A0ABT4LM61_9PROT|nr:methyltransferase domain-containing protein [Kiloniella laminariae]MCZ4282164.1 methyltransferase domain-containing protein [Kiloniella laminariae]